MGKKINFRAGDNLRMFQLFKRLIHQTDRNEFYCDGTEVVDKPGVMVDFQNVEHTYEIFRLLDKVWGGWNSCPTSDNMFVVAKRWEEIYGAEIIDIGYDCIDFKIKV